MNPDNHPIPKKVVLAYSGGLDTSVIIRWLIERYQCTVVAFVADIGQGDELEGIEKKAMDTGAEEVFIDDLREEFLRDYVFPLYRANAVYEGSYLLGTSIARPLIAKRQIKIAKLVGADAVAHGATGKGNDQVRFELTYYSIDPGINVIAPWREWEFEGRGELIEYAKKHDIPVSVSVDKPYSCDRNLLHMSFEGGILEDPWIEPPGDMYKLTNSPEDALDKPCYVEIDFEEGDPVRVDGEQSGPVELWERLNELGGAHGIGRVDIVESRYVGLKSRGVYENPGGTIVHIAHRAIESITLDREVIHMKEDLASRYAELVYYGYWFSPEREMLQTAIDESQKNVTGTVRLKLYKGNCQVVGRKSKNSLYNEALVSFEKEGGYSQADAEGFIKLNALRLKTRAMIKKSEGE